MSAINDVRQLFQDLLAPELGAIKARLESLEKKVDEYERRAEKRHDDQMAALRQITDYTQLLNRMAQLEARIGHSTPTSPTLPSQ